MKFVNVYSCNTETRQKAIHFPICNPFSDLNQNGGDIQMNGFNSVH